MHILIIYVIMRVMLVVLFLLKESCYLLGQKWMYFNNVEHPAFCLLIWKFISPFVVVCGSSFTFSKCVLCLISTSMLNF